MFSIMGGFLGAASFEAIAAEHVEQGCGEEDEQCEECEDVGHSESPIEYTTKPLAAMFF